MATLCTNVFEITNLRELKSSCKLYRIRGLSTEQEEYDHNRQILIDKLSKKLQTPAIIIKRDDLLYLVLREDSGEPPSPFQLVRTVANFEPTGEKIILDFEQPTDETASICHRFLQFAINGGLRDHRHIWQPSAGQPFFYRNAVYQENGINVYEGASIRVVILEGNRLAVCLDIKHKYISNHPLKTQLSKMEFRQLKGIKCVYHWGSQWYEIRPQELSDYKVNEFFIPRRPGERNLLKADIMRYAPKPHTKELIELNDNGSVLIYPSGKDEPRGAPSSLCYQTFETNDPRIKRLHQSTILSPNTRFDGIMKFMNIIKHDLRFGETKVSIAQFPIQIPKKQFIVPDLEFGHNTILSVRGTKGAKYSSLNELGQARLNALFNNNIGPYVVKPLDKQYLIWPKSVADTYGPVFLQELKDKVNQLYPDEVPYDPELIEYDDSGPRKYVTQGRAILQAVESESHQPGLGIVMLHEDENRKHRQEDQLASMVMRELRKNQIYVSVIHTTVANQSYELPGNVPKGTYREVGDVKKQRKLEGYLRNVAITKVLLTNERWPFVLATSLHSDLTIGIDVKHHTACFSFFGKSGADVRTVIKSSNQKEKLSRDQVKTILFEILQEEYMICGRNVITSIVIHRDGRIFDTEIKGIKAAFRMLQSLGAVANDASLNFIEVSKTSPAPVRLLEVVKKENDRIFVGNPEVGYYWMFSSDNAYLCSTGRAFPRNGTVNPLHVKFIEGTMPFEQNLEDLYFLTCLTWTRPEDCTRNPATIKLADIRLHEHAGAYDTDALEYGDDEKSEEEVIGNE